jgi:hypothetical protein
LRTWQNFGKGSTQTKPFPRLKISVVRVEFSRAILYADHHLPHAKAMSTARTPCLARVRLTTARRATACSAAASAQPGALQAALGRGLVSGMPPFLALLGLVVDACRAVL